MTYKLSPLAYLRFALVCLFCSVVSSLFSQKSDSIPNIKKFDHFIGVQVNPLFQQVFNFGESDPVNNPYLIRYTMRNVESGFALNFGGGLNSNSTETDDGLKTNDDSYDIRVGVGYQKRVSKKLEAGIGLDLIYGNTNRETFSVQVFDFGPQTDSTITRIRNNAPRIGGGVQLNLNYYLSERILIGTECTLYYTRVKNQFNVEIDNYIVPNSQNPNVPMTRSVIVLNEEETARSFVFSLPVAIYLSYKF